MISRVGPFFIISRVGPLLYYFKGGAPSLLFQGWAPSLLFQGWPLLCYLKGGALIYYFKGGPFFIISRVGPFFIISRVGALLIWANSTSSRWAWWSLLILINYIVWYQSVRGFTLNYNSSPFVLDLNVDGWSSGLNFVISTIPGPSAWNSLPVDLWDVQTKTWNVLSSIHLIIYLFNSLGSPI